MKKEEKKEGEKEKGGGKAYFLLKKKFCIRYELRRRMLSKLIIHEKEKKHLSFTGI